MRNKSNVASIMERRKYKVTKIKDNVESRTNSHEFGDAFDHLVVHVLFCTFERKDVSVMGYGGLKFGSLDK